MAFHLADHWVWDFWLADDGDTLPPVLSPCAQIAGQSRSAASQCAHRPCHLDRSAQLDRPRPGLRRPASRAPSTAAPPGPAASCAAPMGSGACSIPAPGFSPRTATPISRPSASRPRPISSPGPSSPDRSASQIRAGTKRSAPRRWPEEAWRDPWVFRHEPTELWHMLVTARGKDGVEPDRGVMAHATRPI